MESLILKGKEDTPEVLLDKDKGRFSLSGNSFSDDPVAVFQPIFDWLNKYIAAPNAESLFEIKMNYVNTSSSKQLLEFLKTIERIPGTVTVRWYYDMMDEDMEFEGKTLQSVVKVNMELVGY